MYGLSKDEKLDFLLEKELIQVAIGLNQVILNFYMDISIDIGGEFNHLRNSRSLIKNKKLPRSAISLVELLGAHITDIKNSGDGTLELLFSNGDRLQIFDSEKNYESYTITLPDGTMVVV